jgi:hypothetical protein
MEHAKIVQKVRDILNEHGGDDGLNIGTDRVLLDEYIESAIPDAVIMLAQKGYRVNVCADSPRINGDNAIILPNDFISLLSVKLDNWKKIITKIIEVGSPEYIMAMNEFTTPKINTPMCYKKGTLLICLPDSDVCDLFEYNKNYDKEEDFLSAEPKEATAVCYMTAALVSGMFGDDQGKQRLSDIATNMLQ